MTKVNPNSGDKTKSDIFPRNIFKSDNIFFLSKNIKVFQWLSKFLSFMTKVTQTMEMKQNQTFFHETYSNLTLFTIIILYLHNAKISS